MGGRRLTSIGKRGGNFKLIREGTSIPGVRGGNKDTAGKATVRSDVKKKKLD